MTEDTKRGPGRPRKEGVESEADVIRQPVAPGDESPELTQYREAEQRRKENIAVEQFNIAQAIEDQANADRAQADADKASAAERKKAKKAYSGSTAEVVITRKYAPKYLVDEDGDLVPQDNSGATKSLEPGTAVYLPKDEAIRALQLGIAQVTTNSLG